MEGIPIDSDVLINYDVSWQEEFIVVLIILVFSFFQEFAIRDTWILTQKRNKSNFSKFESPKRGNVLPELRTEGS